MAPSFFTAFVADPLPAERVGGEPSVGHSLVDKTQAPAGPDGNDRREDFTFQSKAAMRDLLSVTRPLYCPR